jgi:hypothetical protein
MLKSVNSIRILLATLDVERVNLNFVSSLTQVNIIPLRDQSQGYGCYTINSYMKIEFLQSATLYTFKASSKTASVNLASLFPI